MKTTLAALIVLFCLTSLAIDFTLVWNDSNPPGEVDGYRVYQATNVDGPFVFFGDSKTTNFLVKGLTSGVYFWIVTCTNSWCESLPSNIYSNPSAPGKVIQLRVNSE